MGKLYKIITVVAIATILFTGCSKNQTTEIGTQETETVSEFTLTTIVVRTPDKRDEACHFYKDPVTDIVYMQFKGSYGNGGLIWMPDPDTGLPLKYDRFSNLYEEYIQTDE